jgi:plasmid stability protein
MNLTVTVDDEVLRRARVRALGQGTSVNAVLRQFLESYAGAEKEADARVRLVDLARASQASSRKAGRSWSREDLYADRLERPRRSR